MTGAIQEAAGDQCGKAGEPKPVSKPVSEQVTGAVMPEVADKVIRAVRKVVT